MKKADKDEIEEINEKENTAKKPETEKKVETKKEVPDEQEKLMKIVNSAKEKGKITYGELAAELGEANSEEIDKVFEAFEELGVNILKDDDDDLLEPDIEDLEEVEDIKAQLLNCEDYPSIDDISIYISLKFNKCPFRNTIKKIIKSITTPTLSFLYKNS